VSGSEAMVRIEAVAPSKRVRWLGLVEAAALQVAVARKEEGGGGGLRGAATPRVSGREKML
jgi:hypothetical protein